MKIPAGVVGIAVVAVAVLGGYWANKNIEHGSEKKEVVVASAASSTPVPPQKLEMRQKAPGIAGTFNAAEDGTEFIAVSVPNECGTYAKPEECIVKEVKVSTPPIYEMDGVELNPPWSSYDIQQVTFKLQEGGYETFACAVAVREDEDHPAPKPETWSCDQTQHYLEIELVAVDRYRFGRNKETISFRPYRDPKLKEDRIYNPNEVYYFMSLGKCASIHECQSVPRQRTIPNYYWEKIAPQAWKRARDRAAREARLNSPR